MGVGGKDSRESIGRCSDWIRPLVVVGFSCRFYWLLAGLLASGGTQSTLGIARRSWVSIERVRCALASANALRPAIAGR